MPNGITKKLSELMELPAEVLSGMPVTVIRGRDEVEVEGCTGILEYEAHRVVLALKRERLTVTGEGLALEDFRDGTLRVCGKIASAVFDEEES